MVERDDLAIMESMHAVIRLVLATALIVASLGFASAAPCGVPTETCCPMSSAACATDLPDCALRISNADLSARLTAQTHGHDPAATAVLPGFLPAPLVLAGATWSASWRAPHLHALPRYLELRSLRL